VIRLELSEDVTFLNKANILKTLNQMPNNTKVIIDASRCIEIEHDVNEIIEDFVEGAKYRNIEVEVINRKFKGLQESPVAAFQRTLALSSQKNMEKWSTLKLSSRYN